MSAPTPTPDEIINQLRFDIPGQLKQDFVGKDEVIELMLRCTIAREHLLLLGPPGTAKSELVKRFVTLLGARKNSGELFEYLLTRFTEPNEIFGPVNIKEFQGGTFTRNIDRALPQAHIAFLDEVFKANSAILNALLTILNERFFFNGLQQVPVPLISVYGAANEVPESDELAALYDRFLVRVRTDNVDERQFPQLLNAGWSMERQRIREERNEHIEPVLKSIKHLAIVYKELENVDLAPIFDEYRELVRQIRAEGISLSDRRAIKLLKLIAASTLLRGERTADVTDLWILRHIWNKPEQVSALQSIVGPVIEQAGGRDARAERPIDEVALDVQNLQQRISTPNDQRAPTVTYYSALLHDLERTRHELHDHSAGQRTDGPQEHWQQLMEQVETLTDTVLDHLEAEERI
jgi:MoxR-like ATPase